jgi:1-acyl-sn-glycerol-3-phosphate acyltransferase
LGGQTQFEDAANGETGRTRFGLPIELPGEDGGMFDVARELLSTDYYLRQWGRIGMRNRSEVVDDFGLDPKYDARLRPLMDLLYTRYFRAQVDGMDHVPVAGPALLVANHSGSLPYDALMLKTALRREHGGHRSLRWLVENHVFYMPFVGSLLNRMGAVRACQENAERVLRSGQLLAVFPEGQKGQGRLYRDRYRLQRFGRGGFIRLCMRTRTPLVPCAIVGPEEAMPLLYKLENFARIGGVPYMPITPTFPWLGPIGLVPAPTRWYFLFGAPIAFDAYGPDAATDDVLVGRLSERVRATIQTMIDGVLASRRSVWLG